MWLLTSSLSLLLWTSAASAEETLREFSWGGLRGDSPLSFGEVLSPDARTPFDHLKVENREDRPKTVTILTLEPPGIARSRYAIRGDVRYESVEGKGYLEMWNFFPGGASYFSRTIEQSGPMKSLEGSSDWRSFVLPFFISEGSLRPEKLVVNVVFAGRGRVYLGPLRLIEYGPDKDPLAAPGQWWSDRTGGLLGGILGSLLGCMGALIGGLASAGKARAFVLALTRSVIFLGVAALVFGSIALARSQPYSVVYPLLLVGLLSVVVPAVILPTLRRRYEEHELRRMRALDAP